MDKKTTTITAILPKDLFDEFDQRIKKEARHKAHVLKLMVRYYVNHGLDDIIEKLENDVEDRR